MINIHDGLAKYMNWLTGGRSDCEDSDSKAQAMIFDLHNLVPSVGQINALKSNDRYSELDSKQENGTDHQFR